jgi:tetrahydromethanopterin S-methyltransferase subunit B
MTLTIVIIAVVAYFYLSGLEKRIEDLENEVDELESKLNPSDNSEYDF